MSEFNVGDPLGDDGLEPSQNEKLSRLGVGSSGADGAGKPKLKAQQVVLLAVLVIGGGLLFGMRKLGMGPELVIADPGISYEPRSSGARPSGELQRLMASLEQSSSPVQIPLESVQRNPFEIRAVLEARANSGQAPVDEEAIAAEAARRAAEKLEQEMKQALSRLGLQSTMDGRVPVARINNEFFRIGDRVGEHFMLVRIDGRTAVLSSDDGREFVLVAGENTRQQHRGTPRRR